MDSFIYALVLSPALTELLPKSGMAILTKTWALLVRSFCVVLQLPSEGLWGRA